MKNNKDIVIATVFTVVLFSGVFTFNYLKTDKAMGENNTTALSEKNTSLDLEKLQTPVYITVFKFILNTSLLK